MEKEKLKEKLMEVAELTHNKYTVYTVNDIYLFYNHIEISEDVLTLYLDYEVIGFVYFDDLTKLKVYADDEEKIKLDEYEIKIDLIN